MSFLFRLFLIVVAILFLFRWVGRMLSRGTPKRDAELRGKPKNPPPPLPSEDIRDADFKDITE
ncbi:hypothetical protein KKG05_00220 [bacterium]|nr:hypothetical protein [bacterium]MBU1935795.1 hypothetical protein [bacterium]